jgi:hypothetical protein
MRGVEKLAALDRIEDGKHAVLIVGDPTERELRLPVEQLLDEDRLVSASIDHEATAAARNRVRSKLEQLRKRGRRLGGR